MTTGSKQTLILYQDYDRTYPALDQHVVVANILTGDDLLQHVEKTGCFSVAVNSAAQALLEISR